MQSSQVPIELGPGFQKEKDQETHITVKTVEIVPHGWPCKLIECPPGLFSFTGDIGFKSEYFQNDVGKIEVFCAESGECFWGGANSKENRANLIVQPVVLTLADT